MSETNTTENSATPQIGVVELENCVRIIDAAAERGAFKGNELTAVGNTRDRIAAFLTAIAPAAPEAEAVDSASNTDPLPDAQVTKTTTVSKKSKK